MLFTFPSRYLFTIGLSGVFSLARWCWRIQTEFHRLRPTQDTNLVRSTACTGLSPPTVQLSRCLPLHLLTIMSVLQPHCSLNCSGLGYSAFARHYLRNHYCFLFLRLLRCFSSPGLPPDYAGYHVFNVVGFPIRKSADQFEFANPRSLSQLITSFFASESQGIPHTPFIISSVSRISFARKPKLGISMTLSQHVKELLDQFNET